MALGKREEEFPARVEERESACFVNTFGSATDATEDSPSPPVEWSSLDEPPPCASTASAIVAHRIRLWVEEDPWTGSNTSEQLSEFRSWWEANEQTTPRDLAHFLSGRGLGGGISGPEGDREGLVQEPTRLVPVSCSVRELGQPAPLSQALSRVEGGVEQVQVDVVEAESL